MSDVHEAVYRNTQLRKAFANVLGSTDSHATAVHVKPASALQSSRFSLDYLLLPPRSALTAAPGRPTPRTVRATATTLLLTATWRALHASVAAAEYGFLAPAPSIFRAS